MRRTAGSLWLSSRWVRELSGPQAIDINKLNKAHTSCKQLQFFQTEWSNHTCSRRISRMSYHASAIGPLSSEVSFGRIRMELCTILISSSTHMAWHRRWSISPLNLKRISIGLLWNHPSSKSLTWESRSFFWVLERWRYQTYGTSFHPMFRLALSSQD